MKSNLGRPLIEYFHEVNYGYSSQRGPAGLLRDAGFATFLDGISGNWVLKLQETGLDTPEVPGMP